MTKGEKLKKDLGLSKFKQVRITRCIDSSTPIYFILTDSRNFPLTNHRVWKDPGKFALYTGQRLPKKSSFTPLIDIEEFNPSTLNGRTFIRIDLAGSNLVDKGMYESLDKSLFPLVYYLPKLKLDEITLFDLRDKDIVSDLTKKYKNIRQKKIGGANKNTKLISCEIQNKDITFKFLTEATPEKDDLGNDKPKKETNPSSFELGSNPSKTYEIWLKFPNALDLLDLQNKETIDRKDIKNLLEANDVQLWSNSPSFVFQGFDYWLTQLDASIFPNEIKPQRWDKYHGDGQAFLDKHTSQLINQIQFFLNPMANMLTKQLKDQGLIGKK